MNDSKIDDWLRETRRRFHRIPELSFHEFRTQEMVIEIMQGMVIEGRPIAGTGVVAEIHGSRPGPCIAIRSDMDGLEVSEESTHFNSVYISQNPGFMHACGHDAHMAMVLGAARLLAMKRDSLSGTVRLIFQPGEEQPPGGALEVIKDGGLTGVDAIVGLHVFSSINSGEVKFRRGAFMGTSNIMKIKIRGKGGHHLSPELCIDPISIASGFVGRINYDIKKRIPGERFIMGFGRIAGGAQFNRTPDHVEVMGSFRTFDDADTRIIEDTIRQTLDDLMKIYAKEEYPGLPEYELDIQHGYPVLVNDPVFSSRALDILGKEFPAVDDDIEPFFGAEDFAYYLRHVPGVFIGLGTRNDDMGIIEGNHSSRFDIDESILAAGARMLAVVAQDFLEHPGEYLE